MLTIETEVSVKGIKGADVLDFMLNCTDEAYQNWWKGTHLAFHTIQRTPDNLGNLVYFDEYVGNYRLKFKGVVTEITPGKKIIWQMVKLIRLPTWLVLGFEDREEGVRITHTIKAGSQGIGAIFDPFIKIYFSREFEREMEKHGGTI